MIEGTLLNSIVKILLTWLPGFVLRTILNEDRLSRYIVFSPRATGEQVTFYNGDTPEVEIWLDVDNRGPFTIEIDRLIVELRHMRSIGELYYLDRTKIKGGTLETILIRGLKGVRFTGLNPSHGANPNSYIKIRGYFNSKVMPFKAESKNITSIHIDINN